MDKYKQTVDNLFSNLLGYVPVIDYQEEDSEINLNLEIEPQDSGLLIGYHGEVLTAIQLYLNLVYYQQFSEKKPVRLNINNYRQQRQQILENLALSTAQKALERNQPIPIHHLSSYERRIVHLFLSDRSDVKTYSQGEPPHRSLVIAPADKT